jgi:hypothetical protein
VTVTSYEVREVSPIEAPRNVVEKEGELVAWREVRDAFGEHSCRSDWHPTAIGSILCVNRAFKGWPKQELRVARHRGSEVRHDELQERWIPLVEVHKDEWADLRS